jgi:hypothetical protein
VRLLGMTMNEESRLTTEHEMLTVGAAGTRRSSNYIMINA